MIGWHKDGVKFCRAFISTQDYDIMFVFLSETLHNLESLKMQFREIIRPSSTTAGGPDIYYKMSAAAGNLSIYIFYYSFFTLLGSRF